MKKKPNPKNDSVDLHVHPGQPGHPSPPPETDPQQLIQSLQANQARLETQNAELQRSRSEADARLEEYTELFDFAPVGYFTLASDGRVLQANLYGARLLQVERIHLAGLRFGQFLREDNRSVFNTFLERVFDSQAKETCELELMKEGYVPLWIQVEAIASFDRQKCYCAVLDITPRKQAEIQLQYMSMHDALTGLYNRAYFIETMRQFERGRHFPLSILIADVDHLRTINERFGRLTGDELLIRAAHVFSSAFRAEDTVARIGGGEFAALLPRTDSTTASEILRRFVYILKEHNSSFPEPPLHLTFGQYTAEKKFSLNEMLKEADADLYREKRKRDAASLQEEPLQKLRAAELRRPSEEARLMEPDKEDQEILQVQGSIEAGLQHYTELFDFAPVAYFSLGPDGTIIQANLNAARLLGMERPLLERQNLGQFIANQDRDTFSSFLKIVFATRKKQTCAVVLAKPSASPGAFDETHPQVVRIEGALTQLQDLCQAVIIEIPPKD